MSSTSYRSQLPLSKIDNTPAASKHCAVANIGSHHALCWQNQRANRPLHVPSGRWLIACASETVMAYHRTCAHVAKAIIQLSGCCFSSKPVSNTTSHRSLSLMPIVKRHLKASAGVWNDEVQAGNSLPARRHVNGGASVLNR